MKPFTLKEQTKGTMLAEYLSEYIHHPSDEISDYRLRSAARRMGFKSFRIVSGRYNRVLVTKRLVFKVPRFWQFFDLESDARYITKARQNRKYRPYFPPTQYITEGYVQLLMQRRIPAVGSNRHRGEWLLVGDYAEKYFSLGDMHVLNFGWHNKRPVFIDVNHSRTYNFLAYGRGFQTWAQFKSSSR